MNETSVPAEPIQELPVLDPTAFFLHRDNPAFLRQERIAPITEATHKNTVTLAVTAMMGVLFGVIVIAGANDIAYMAVGGFIILISCVGGVMTMYSTLPSPIKRYGQVIIGTVVESEKIRIHARNTTTENIGVQYAFVAPNRKRIQDRAEAPTSATGSTMAPAPGTPVYVWYESEEKYYLL